MNTTAPVTLGRPQLSTILNAVQVRKGHLQAAKMSAARGLSATARYQDSAAALGDAAERHQALAYKLCAALEYDLTASVALTRDDLEHALVAVSVQRRLKACSTDRAAAVALSDLVSLLADLLADETLVHDEY
jgi:hypothetical protein